MSLKDVLKSWLVRLSGWDLTVYICIVIAVAGGFVCGRNNIILWYMLVFHCYTDIKSMEVYVLPVRSAIIAETVILFCEAWLFIYGLQRIVPVSGCCYCAQNYESVCTGGYGIIHNAYNCSGMWGRQHNQLFM